MITFFGMPDRTSGEIRGRQVSEALGYGARFVDVHNPNNFSYANEFCLFVRTWEPRLAKHLKDRGHVVGYEVADMPVGDAVFRNMPVNDLSAYAHEECSFFVVNNNLQKSDMTKVTDKPVYVIPHHTVNYEGHRNAFKRAQRVGYVGLPEQLSAKDEIDELCREKNVDFISIHPNTRQECVEVMKTIDIGIVFAESDGKITARAAELMKKYKPNTKLSNFQSFGIRTICTPYQSYIEFGASATTFEMTREGMLHSLNRMIDSDSDLEKRDSDLAYEAGKQFHVTEIVKHYNRMVLDVK